MNTGPFLTGYYKKLYGYYKLLYVYYKIPFSDL